MHRGRSRPNFTKGGFHVRITILTVGSRGDVQPFIALGRRMRAAGLDVTLATHTEWAASIQAAGLRFKRVEGAPHRFMY
jgi:sterol 3beta-glucosyltransferase